MESCVQSLALENLFGDALQKCPTEAAKSLIPMKSFREGRNAYETDIKDILYDRIGMNFNMKGAMLQCTAVCMSAVM